MREFEFKFEFEVPELHAEFARRINEKLTRSLARWLSSRGVGRIVDSRDIHEYVYTRAKFDLPSSSPFLALSFSLSLSLSLFSLSPFLSPMIRNRSTEARGKVRTQQIARLLFKGGRLLAKFRSL